MDTLKNFQSSPACTEFLQNLPERDDSQASVESGSTLGYLILTDASSSSAPKTSCFLIFKHFTPAVTADVEGRVVLIAFLVPRKVDNVSLMWKENFDSVFECFIPRGYASIASRPGLRFPRFAAVWLWVFSEDGWVEKKFRKLEQTQNDDQGRTVICHSTNGHVSMVPSQRKRPRRQIRSRASVDSGCSAGDASGDLLGTGALGYSGRAAFP